MPRPSRYSTITHLPDGIVLLYSGWTGAVLSVDGEQAGPVVARLEHDDWSQPLSLSAEERLLYGGFLVPDDYDESAELRRMRLEGRLDSSSMGLTICPTLRCNLACIYCFETTQETGCDMSDEVAAEVVAMAQSAAFRGTKQASITWYGGEPLLALDRVVSLQKQLQSVINVNRTGIITNGTLLTPEAYAELGDIGVGYVQITLDGDCASHDARRRLGHSHGGTYSLIVDNLRRLPAEGPRISIRVNVDRSNAAAFGRVLSEFSTDSALRRYITRFSPARVISWPSSRCAWREVCYGTEEYGDIEVGLADEAYRLHGVRLLRLPKPRRGMACTALHANSHVIGPSGELYRCWNHVGDPGLVTGYLNSAARPNRSIEHFFQTWDPLESGECLSCKVLPSCAGGCAAMALLDMKDSHPRCQSAKFNLEQVLLRSTRG